MKKSQDIWFFKRSVAARLARKLGRPYRLHAADVPPGTRRGALQAIEPQGPAVWLADPASDSASALRRLARRHPELRLIAVAGARSSRSRSLAGREWFTCLPPNAPAPVARRAVDSAFENIALAGRERAARRELTRVAAEQESLSRIGVALSAVREMGELLVMILAMMREITSADAGSLYIVEGGRPGNSRVDSLPQRLRFRLMQNDSRELTIDGESLPISANSITGYAVLNAEIIALDDAYAIPRDRPYHFDAVYDELAGYRTRSVLTVPMKNARGEVLGVVQLLNCKRHKTARLLTDEDVARKVQPFPPRAARLAESLASQAAVAYENSCLYQDIETLFEGFVNAAVTAIEQRDPTTSGHSQRVSRMTVGLAEIVDRSITGTYRSVRFTPDQMKEIRYAGLLHDFGKVGIREDVLVKAKKLYPSQFDIIQNRFDYVRKEIEARCERRKFRALLELSRDEALRRVAELDEEFRRAIAELDDSFGVIVESNEPTILAAGKFEKLFELAGRTYCDPRGNERPLLTPDETRFLSIRRGSLDPQERRQIESHVLHSFNFLMQIPWTRSIREIPQIVRAHHEKLDGSGYPLKLKENEIPVQARMMTICDIFDALSAADRPYKKAVPTERALAILEDSAANHEVDTELFRLFVEARIYELPHRPS